MHNFLADVVQTMLSCRRTQATVQDFLQALHTHQLSLRALLPHIRPPIRPCDARVPLLDEPQEEEEEQYNHQFLGVNSSTTLVERSKPYVPRNFPVLPSKHTYKATPEYPVREEDPRKVRERATGEGRLGEEALRRLVSARATDRPPPAQAGQGAKSLRVQRDEIWKETMQAMNSWHASEQSRNADTMDLDGSEHDPDLLQKASSDYGRIISVVNADKKYWRKPAPAEGTSQGRNDGIN